MKKIILTAVVFCFALAANVKAEPCHFGKDCKNGQKAVAEQNFAAAPIRSLRNFI